jgi:hypothetical protein
MSTTVPSPGSPAGAPITAVPVRLGAGPAPRRVPAPVTAPDAGAFTIDCGDCRHQQTSVCDDCVVSFIVDRRPDDAVVVDAHEARAVRLLGEAGLVPGVRHHRRAG